MLTSYEIKTKTCEWDFETWRVASWDVHYWDFRSDCIGIDWSKSVASNVRKLLSLRR